MNKMTIVVLILVILTVFSFAVYSYLTDKGIDDYLKLGRFGEPESGSGEDDGSELASLGGASGTSGGGGEGGGGGGGGSGGGDSIIEEPLPDFDSAPCGLYTGEYGVCSGTCPSGTCVSEGRSCYCKK